LNHIEDKLSLACVEELLPQFGVLVELGLNGSVLDIYLDSIPVGAKGVGSIHPALIGREGILNVSDHLLIIGM
jgi:hypothetical protein